MWQCFLDCQMLHIFSKILHLISYEQDHLFGCICTNYLFLPSSKMHIQTSIWDEISCHIAWNHAFIAFHCLYLWMRSLLSCFLFSKYHILKGLFSSSPPSSSPSSDNLVLFVWSFKSRFPLAHSMAMFILKTLVTWIPTNIMTS